MYNQLVSELIVGSQRYHNTWELLAFLQTSHSLTGRGAPIQVHIAVETLEILNRGVGHAQISRRKLSQMALKVKFVNIFSLESFMLYYSKLHKLVTISRPSHTCRGSQWMLYMYYIWSSAMCRTKYDHNKNFNKFLTNNSLNVNRYFLYVLNILYGHVTMHHLLG